MTYSKHGSDAVVVTTDGHLSSNSYHIWTYLKVLEVFQLCLTRGNVADNPHLIYTILHKRASFKPFFQEPYTSNHALWEPLQRIQALDAFFTPQMVARELTTYEAIIALVQDEAHKFSAEQHRSVAGQPVPEKYTYEEQSGPDEFFSPYLWQVIRHPLPDDVALMPCHRWRGQ